MSRYEVAWVTFASPLFTILGAVRLSAAPLQLLMPVVLESGDIRYGLITRPPGAVINTGGPELLRSMFIGAIQVFYVEDEITRLLGCQPTEIEQVFDDLALTEFQPERDLTVESHHVDAFGVTYLGLRFAAPVDFLTYPFVIARSAEIDAPWPAVDALRTERLRRWEIP